MANGNNGNQFRDDEIIILEQLRDGKMVKNIYPKIGGRLRLAHDENDQFSITTEILKYDENLAAIREVTSISDKALLISSGICSVLKGGATSTRTGRACDWKSKDSASPKVFEKCLPRQHLYSILCFARFRIETYQQGSSYTVFFFKPTEPFQMGLIGELCRLHFDRYLMIAQNKVHLEP
jgi:hypothetical protein